MLANLDRRLDMSLCFSTPLGSSKLPFLNENEPISLDMHFHKDSTFLNFFVEKSALGDYEIYNYYNPVLFGNFVMIAQKFDLRELRIIHENIASIPSMVMGGLYTSKGNMMVDFRFHNSDKQKVADVVKLLVSINAGISVTEMGRSDGIRAKLDEIDPRAPLTVVKFSYGEEGNNDYVWEWRGKVDPLGAVSYGADASGDIGRLDISNTPIAPHLRSIIKDQIPVPGYFENHHSGRVQSLAIVPSFLTEHFLIRFFDKTEKISDIRLESIETYREARENL